MESQYFHFGFWTREGSIKLTDDTLAAAAAVDVWGPLSRGQARLLGTGPDTS